MKLLRGFTLIELLMTLMISSIIAVISVQFIGRSTQAMLDGGERQQAADSADIISEQISRRIRFSLPGSLRVSNDGRCIEFMPLLAVTAYTEVQRGQLIEQITALPVSTTEEFSGYLSIYPLLGNLYRPADTGPITATTETLPAGVAAVVIHLSSPHRFPQLSPSQRLFISAEPQAICQQGEWLYLYSGYGFLNNVNQLQANLPSDYASGREVLANGLQPSSMSFSYLPSTLRRNALLTFRFNLLTSAGSVLTVAQEVQVRNVP